MIVFAEERQLVIDGYQERFNAKGESLEQISGADVLSWIDIAQPAELAAVEAIIIGQCQDECQVISRLRARCDAPMIALVDRRNLAEVIRLFNAGCDDVVCKPVHFEELLARIATIKRRGLRGTVQADKNQGSEIHLYFDGRDPVIGGRTINLPRRERRILEYLASLKGRRATRTQIFNAIYGMYDECIEESVVESHISKLRKKLKSQLGYDPIDSRRFLGYSLSLSPGIISEERQAACA
jgi:two-component system, OmpR family, flagellar system response regulator FtcR